MKRTWHFIFTWIPAAVALAAFGLVASVATATTVNATYNAATDVPVTTNSFTATGNTVSFTLNFAPDTGSDLMVVKNTGLSFINGTFDNLTNGQAVALSYGGVTYRFVANYYGGSGNDLVLVWASHRPFAWGNNGDGELGNNSTTQSQLPAAVEVTGVLAGKTVMAIATGGYHSLALCSDGTLAAWGWNGYGQLGDNSTTDRLVPVAVNRAAGVSALYGKTVVAIAAGVYHSLALCSDGTVAAWGYNGSGQLGDNTTTQQLVPVAVNTNSGVSVLYGKTVVSVAGGAYHSLALCSDGTMAAWGGNYFGQLGDGTFTTSAPNGETAAVAVNTVSGVSALNGKTVAAIAAGSYHSLALCSDGSVAAWGRNDFGQLGNNTTTNSSVPVAVNTASNVSALYGKTVMAIAAGGTHNLAMASDRAVAAWGYNGVGQLGNNTTASSSVPVAVDTAPGDSALYGKAIVAIAAGYSHSLALCSDSSVAAWGANGNGQLGDNTTTTGRNTPVAVKRTPLAAGQRFTRVAWGSSADHALALVAAPAAAAVSLTGAKRLGDGSFQFGFTNTPSAFFGVLAATNPALALGNWPSLTGLTEVSPGQFQFTDPQATSTLRHFYRVRSP